MVESLGLTGQARPGTLMEIAGLAVAKLAVCLARPGLPILILCGPGNNGGDGMVAARWLHCQGLPVAVVLCSNPEQLPPDAQQAFRRMTQAGIQFHTSTPRDTSSENWGLVIDAMLGLGQRRPPEGQIKAWVQWCCQSNAPLLAVDLPTGLHSDTGMPLGEEVIRATATLSLLTLKPGLLTGHGRDLAGDVWVHHLGIPFSLLAQHASGWVAGSTTAQAAHPKRRHVQHKGSFGDVWILGGTKGMTGAVWLAGRAAVAAGAGRVFVSPLDTQAAAIDPLWPELMLRPSLGWQSAQVLERATVVCGCGGGNAIADILPEVLTRSARLVLDADALNAVASSKNLQQLLSQRAARYQPTILTPHPLEAARLRDLSTSQIQQDRVQQALALAQQTKTVVLLKGSGTVIAAPDATASTCWINRTGTAALATPGSGDVLAGWLGACWSLAPSAATPSHASTPGPDTPPGVGGSAAVANGDAVPAASPTQDDAHHSRWNEELCQIAAAAAWTHGHAAEQLGSQPRLPMHASQLITELAATVRTWST